MPGHFTYISEAWSVLSACAFEHDAFFAWCIYCKHESLAHHAYDADAANFDDGIPRYRLTCDKCAVQMGYPKWVGVAPTCLFLRLDVADRSVSAVGQTIRWRRRDDQHQ